jgi:putative selenium metabolism hydrolase
MFGAGGSCAFKQEIEVYTWAVFVMPLDTVRALTYNRKRHTNSLPTGGPKVRIGFPASHAEAMAKFLQDLVRIPSLSTQEEAVAIRMAEEMKHVGFEEVRTDRIGNVIGRVGSGQGPALLLNGHMDTVDVGEPSRWPHPPYEGVIENGVLHGRGACDMKGGLAAMVYGVKALLDAGVELAGNLYVVGVVQEEPCEGLAMRVLVEEEGLRPDYVLLGEPSNLHVRVGHRGRLEMQVSVQGKAAHASSPSLGSNAIHNAARLIFGIELLASRLGTDPFLGQGTLAVTEIDSQAASRNALPDCCSFVIDRRLTLGETERRAVAEVQSLISTEEVEARVEVTQYQARSYTGYECRARNAFPAWVMPEDDHLVQTTVRCVRETLGYRPRLGRWPFSTDGTYTAGVADIPTVGFGPGEERYAHTVDEQIRLNDVVDAARVYARLAVELLGTS